MNTPIRLIVGLGNPRSKYDQTRHNAGFWFLDAVSRALGVGFASDKRLGGAVAKARFGDDDVRLFEPDCFMNESGLPVGRIARYFKIRPEQILVAYDELDLPPGTARLKFNGGHGGHNGMRDVIQHLGSRAFWRLRLGIGHPGAAHKVVHYVLSRPTANEQAEIERSIDSAVDQLEFLLKGQQEKAMLRLHTTPKQEGNN